MVVFKKQQEQYEQPIGRWYSLKRSFTQIFDTTYFEIIRYIRRTIFLVSLYVVIFIFFFLLTNRLYSDPNNPLPINSVDYITNYLSLIGLMILIIAITYGSSIIVEDFEKQTGNLIFPNITKPRLLTGRFIAGYLLGMLSIIVFYFLISLDVFIHYNALPIELWISMFWAILYLFPLLALVTFLSSCMRSTALVAIVSFIGVMVLFVIARNLIIFTGYTGEPFFLMNYFGDIISASLNMPSPRYKYVTLAINIGKGNNVKTYLDWLTPSPIDAFIGMIAYGIFFLVLAYYIFEKRQNS